MADVLELKGENPFRIRAYRRATQNLESLSEDIQAVARENRLEDVLGIGGELAGKIQEYLQEHGKHKGHYQPRATDPLLTAGGA